MSKISCFFCYRDHTSEDLTFENIESCRVPASGKTVELVIKHLGNCIKTTLEFQPGAYICTVCLKELSKYDSLMVDLLSFQSKLTQQLTNILNKNELNSSNYNNLDSNIVLEDDTLMEDLDSRVQSTDEFIELDCNFVEVNDELNDGDDSIDDITTCNPVTKKRSKQECVVCGETFKSKILLQSHITEIHNAKTYSCNICGAVRRDEEYLELHMNIHEGKTENECRYCPKRFSRPVNTLRHMRKHWDKKKFQCEKCGERFSLDNMLYNHRLRHEAEENPLICSICNQSFRSRKTFNHHMLIHQENRPRHHCTICSKSFTERYTLKVHMNRHCETSITESAPVHEEDYQETAEATTALIITDDPAFSENTCVICNIKCENKDILEEHLQQDHDVILK